jgi:hypothetical protein
MNDAERLIFEGNLRRLEKQIRSNSKETDQQQTFLNLEQRKSFSRRNNASLPKKQDKNLHQVLSWANIESRIKQLEASGEDLSKMKGQTLDEIMGDVMQTQKTMSKMQDEGLVRAAVRYKMMDDLKRGTLKLPKNLEDVVRGASNEEDVITVFRNNYGEDALEQVDSLIPDFYNMTSPADAVKKIEKDFPNMKPKKIEVKQTMDLDEAKKAEQENILTPGKAITADSPEGKKITEALIGKPKAEVVSLPTAEKILSDMRNLGPIDAMKEANKVLKREGPYKNLTDKDIEKIMDDINDHIFGGDLPVDPEDFATGGRVGFNEGSKLTDYIKTNISANTSSSSPEEGVKVKQEIIDGIVSLNIPLNKKLKLLGSLNFGKSRAKVDLSELGKKYGIDLDEQVYKDKYLSPGLGAEYITDEGTKFNLMVNPEDKGGSVSVSRSFATGGRVGYMGGGSTGLDYLMGIDRKKYANGSLDEFLKSTTLVSPSGKSYDYDFIQSLPQSLNTAINKFGFDAVIGKDGGETGGTVPGKYTPYYSAMEADSGGGTGLKGEYTFLQDYILKPENLVRDYGLEGAKKILTPYRKTITPEPTPAPEIPIAESSPTTSAPVENFINDAVGTGAKEDPILDKYSLFVENYKPTAIPVSNYQTFVDQTGILQPHIQTAFSGLSPFFKQQYQTFATANPEKALEAALQDLKFLVATGNRPSYLQNGGRVGYSDGTKPSAEENTPSQAIINRMIAQIKQMSKMGSDIDTIKEITGASDQMIKDVLGKASGGSVSKGLDYLIGY